VSKRSRAQDEELSGEEAPSQAVDQEAWDTPEFRRSVLISLAFVAAPAIVMAALGERTIAAVWFGVGVLVVLLQYQRQIRGFWRSLRPDRK
jgi:hypothetical protein